jgi:hypothetical protein
LPCFSISFASLPQAADEDDRRLALQLELRRTTAHQLRQLVVNDLHDLLARRQALRHLGAQRTLLDGRDELLDHVEVDVRLEQGEADLAHRSRDVVLAQASARAEVAERVAESVGEGVKHGGEPARRWSDHTDSPRHARRTKWDNAAVAWKSSFSICTPATNR